ncbi:MAG: HEAT repeat protein [Candidatus Paceibacteria bacterium]|jgi:HEAT repeat protein
MSRLFQSIPLGALALLGILFLAPTSAAQLKLPKNKVTDPKAGNAGPTLPGLAKDKPVRKGLVPHLVCSNCGEHNYTSKMDSPQPDGSYTAHCLKCGKNEPHLRSVLAAEMKRVSLPPAGGSNAVPRQAPGGSGLHQGTGLAGGDLRFGDTAAGFILRELASVADPSSTLVEKSVESLLGLSEEGLVTSRIVLHDRNEAVVLAAGRVLVRSGAAEDAERVVARLRTQMPGKSGALLLEELVERNPVYGSPALLVEMLDHKQKPVRSMAMRLLSQRATPEILPLLQARLGSSRSETRLAALELVADVEDPAVLDILLDHVDDRSSRVADFVLEALAEHPDTRADLELLGRALTGQWILRENAFALLAIVEREDEQLRPILDDRHADVLLGGLRSRDALVRGACAAALAGIGYRSSQPLDTTWLDLEVTGTMISAISGREFHSDFTVMQPRVLRRLRLITGEDFGTDGPHWAQWWVSHRVNFYAHRAFLKVPKDGESTLEIHFRGTGRDGGAFSLFGVDAWSRDGETRAGAAEKMLLTRRECLDLLALLDREGTLGPNVPPGVRGVQGRGQRELELIIDGHGKAFIFGSGRTDPWFEKVTSAMSDLRERNLWQRFRPLDLFSGPMEFWSAESGWWALEHSAADRGLRLKDLIFRSVKRMPPSRRTLALHELSKLYEQGGVVSSDDFDLLLDLLRDEGFYAQRAASLLDFAILSGSLQPDGTQGSLDEALGVQLMDLLMARFPQTAVPAMGEVALAIGRDYVHEMVNSERPILRAVAAAELAQNPTEEEARMLIDMLEDPEPVVEAAAVSALGAARVEVARTELLLRARLGETIVRQSALRAIGRLGGEYVLEALVLGVSDPDPEIKGAAAVGLAALEDPQSAPLLISLLRKGRESVTFDTAWNGLLGLGDAARPHLRRVVSSRAHGARRECALLLAMLQDPGVVTALIELLDKKPDDDDVAFELAVLSCVDHRGEETPSQIWLTWYEGVTHGDAMVWLLAAIERNGIPISASANFQGDGSGVRETALIYLELIGGNQDFLAERARRELSTLMGADLGEIPSKEEERNVWLSTLRETILKRFES